LTGPCVGHNGIQSANQRGSHTRCRHRVDRRQSRRRYQKHPVTGPAESERCLGWLPRARRGSIFELRDHHLNRNARGPTRSHRARRCGKQHENELRHRTLLREACSRQLGKSRSARELRTASPPIAAPEILELSMNSTTGPSSSSNIAHWFYLLVDVPRPRPPRYCSATGCQTAQLDTDTQDGGRGAVSRDGDL
jgi:hypothetical protein